MNAIMLEIESWCESRQIAIQAVHVPGILNVVADHQSRLNLETGDWKLRPDYFQQIASLWNPQIDLFSAAWNRQLDKFISWQPQLDAMAVDAFTMDWGKLRGYAFPHFKLIHRCLLKIWRDQADALLLTPVWPAQPWWPTIMKLAYQPPRILKPVANLLSDPEGNPHPLLARGSLLMVAWALSGKDSKTKAFRTKWSTYSWLEIVRPHQLPTRAAGTVRSVGVQNGIKIPCLLL
jgi:hypothetical protein